MRLKPYILLLIGSLFAVGLIAGQPALAALGQPGGSIASDRRALDAGERSAAVHPGYTVREIQSDSVTVREYVSAEDNIVFAVAWKGRMHPDLKQLLAGYWDEYEQEVRETPREPGRRSSSRVKTANVVVETWGHMRNLQGRAYVPGLMPQEVSIDEIR